MENNPNAVVGVEHDRYDVFISYRRSTGLDLARSIAYWFRLKGFKCFLDQTELITGQFNEQIYSAIENTRYFVLLMTEESLERCVNDDDWVRHEVEYAIEKKGRDCIIPVSPVSPPPFPDRLPGTMGFLRNCEVSTIDRQKNFDSTLRTVVENRMPVLFDDIKKRNILSENEAQLLGTIRWYKRNDGTIDADERRKIDEAAREYGISRSRLEVLVSHAEEEVAKEHDAAISRLIESCMADDGNISAEEKSAIYRKAEELQVSASRVQGILVEVEGRKKHEAKENGARRRIRDLERKCGYLKGWLWVAAGFVVVGVASCIFLWFWAEGATTEQMRTRFGSEMARMDTEAKRKVDAAEKACSAVQKELAAAKVANAELEKAMRDAEKREAAFEARLAAEKKNSAEMQAAIRAQADADRRKLEGRANAAEVALRESESKAAQLSADLDTSAAEIKRLKAANEKFAEDLEKARRRMQLDAFRNM